MTSKQFIKTNGDKIRGMRDEDLANFCIAQLLDDFADEPRYLSTITHGVYDTNVGAYQANLEWLKQEYERE